MTDTETIVACLHDLSGLCTESGIAPHVLGAALVAFGAGVLRSQHVPVDVVEDVVRRSYAAEVPR
jgi:hypothetical protein